MNTDHATLPGVRHVRMASPSQDYGLSGPSWGLVSDGCSGGGHTDLGARVWAISLRRVLADSGPAILLKSDWLEKRVMAIAKPWLQQIGGDDGLATLVALGVQNDRLMGTISGDGAFLIQLRSGAMITVDVSCADNRPLYIDYKRDPQLWKRFMEHQEGVTLRFHRYEEDGSLVGMVQRDQATPPHAFLSFDLLDTLDIPMEDVRLAIACTDGIFSRPNVSIGQTLASIVDIKGFNGQFAKRRLGALGAQWAKQSTLPQDDFSIAALHFP